MKKLAIGCAVLLVLGIAGAAAASYITYRKVTTTFNQFAQLGSVPELERSIRKQGPYTPPASGEPSRAQVERLVEVQQAVRTRVGTRADEILHRYRRYFEPVDGRTWVGGTVDTALVTIRFYRDLAGIYVEGKRAQVDALNRAGMSLEEYRWTRSRVYGALGVPLMDIDIARIIEDVKEGRQTAGPAFQMAVDTGGSSPALKSLIESHREALGANAPLAIFGL